jgi:hypothetical protein
MRHYTVVEAGLNDNREFCAVAAARAAAFARDGFGSLPPKDLRLEVCQLRLGGAPFGCALLF